MREKKGGRAVVKLHQKHATIEVVYLAQDGGFFPEANPAIMISHQPN